MINENEAYLQPRDANFIPLSPLSFLNRTKDVYGHRTALIYGDDIWTWREFYDHCVAFQHALKKQAIQKGDVVSFICPNLPAMIMAHFAVPMSGAVLNTINMRLDSNIMSYIFDHSETKLLFVDQQFLPQVKEALSLMKGAKPKIIEITDHYYDGKADISLGMMSFADFLASGDKNADWSMPDNEWQTLALNYTSGTSGYPKGVLYHHRGAYLMTMGTIPGWHLHHHPVYLATVPYFHCNGWGHGWVMASLGGTIICQRQISAKAIYQAIAQYKITHFGGAPIILNMLVNARDDERCDLPHIVEVMTAGSPPPSAILAKMKQLGFNVMQVYGLTETYGHTVHCPWQEEWNNIAHEEQAKYQARQGVCFPITEDLDIANHDTGEKIAHNGKDVGELLIKGNTIMKGYYKDAEATEKAFANGWFHSGDLAVIHDNNYCEIKDRLKDIIISGGENISSVEVESAIFHHPSVSLVAVVAMRDDKWGEVPCAFIELKDDYQDNPPNPQEIIDFTRQYLAGFKIPKKIIYQILPKTATGKIQKFLLRQQLQS